LTSILTAIAGATVDIMEAPYTLSDKTLPSTTTRDGVLQLTAVPTTATMLYVTSQVELFIDLPITVIITLVAKLFRIISRSTGILTAVILSLIDIPEALYTACELALSVDTARLSVGKEAAMVAFTTVFCVLGKVKAFIH